MQDPTQSSVVWGEAHGLLRAHRALAGRYGSNVAICPDPRGGAVVTAGWADESGLDLWAGVPLQVLHAITIAAEPGDEGSALPAWSLPVAALHASPIHSHLQPAVDAAMALRAARMAVAAGRTVHIYDFQTPGSGFLHVGALEGHPEAVVRTGISADGLRVVAALPSGEVWLWDLSNLTILHRLSQSQQPHWTGFLWNDLLVGVGDASGRVVIWEAASGRRHMQFDAHAGAVLGVAASSERGALLTYGADGIARQWDLDEGRQLAHDIVHGSAICGACFAAGGKAIVTLDVDGRLAVTSSADGQLLDWVQLDSGAGARLAVDRTTSAIWVGAEATLSSVDADWAALLALRPSHRNSGRFAPISAPTPMRPANRTLRFEGAPQAPAAPIAPAAPQPLPPVAPVAPVAAPLEPRDNSTPATEGAARLPSTGSHAGVPWQPAEPDRFRTGADSIIGMSPIPLLSHGARVMPSSGAPPVVSVAEVDAAAAAPHRKPAPPVASRPPSSVRAEPPSTGAARREPAPSSMVDQIRASQIIWQESARQSRREVRTTIFVAILAGFVAAAVTWHHFTYRAVPAGVQVELERFEQNQTQTVAQANAAFERYQLEQRATLARYREDTTVLPTELERLQRISERRIEDRRAGRDQAVLEGQARLQVAQAELAVRRTELARRLALTGGLIMGAAAALVAFVLQLGSRAKPARKIGFDRR